MNARRALPVLIAAALAVLASCGIEVPKGDFNVTVATKTTEHPYFGVGSGIGYVVDGVQGKAITLVRGTTYTFGIDAPGHPFYLTTSAVGGVSGLSQEWTAGVTGSRTEVGLLSFTPDQSTPSLLYYQCAVHDNMGWQITITP